MHVSTEGIDVLQEDKSNKSWARFVNSDAIFEILTYHLVWSYVFKKE